MCRPRCRHDMGPSRQCEDSVAISLLERLFVVYNVTTSSIVTLLLNSPASTTPAVSTDMQQLLVLRGTAV